MGFEPMRGDPIGLAGRRLGRSAKVSLLISKPYINGMHQLPEDESSKCTPPPAWSCLQVEAHRVEERHLWDSNPRGETPSA